MKRSNRLLILVGVFLAVIGFVGAVLVAGGSGGGTPVASATTPPEATTTVVVATRDLALGEVITKDMVVSQVVTLTDKAALGDSFTIVEQVLNKTVGGAIPKGTVLRNPSLLQHGLIVDGLDIASGIEKGKVAISMEVDQTNGVGTLIVMNDHVDVLLTVYTDQIALTTTNTNKTTVALTGGSRVTSKLIIQNRKILAVLTPPLVEAPAAPAAPAAGSPTPPPAAVIPVVQNTNRHVMVLLEVTPQEAEVIRWAQREEKTDPQNYIDLGLALRSSKDNEEPPYNPGTSGITFKVLVDSWGVLPADPRGVLPKDLAKGISW